MIGRAFNFVLRLADAVYRKYEEEQEILDREHERRQIQTVRRAYPNGWRPKPTPIPAPGEPRDSL